MEDEFSRIYEAICRPIPFDNLRALYGELRKLGDYSDDLLAVMHENVSRRRWGCLCKLIWAIPEPTSPMFTSILCDLLDNHREVEILEAVADAMFYLRDERAIPSIVRALDVEVPGDGDRNFNKKLIYALVNTGTPAAIEGIKKALQSPEEIIRGTARVELERIAAK
jgi:hypothetical protein